MVNKILWTLINTMIRINALLFIARIFFYQAYKRMAYVFSAICAVHGLASVLVTCLICQPIFAAWDNSVHGTCGNQAVAYVALESVGLLLDLVIVVLPQRPLFGLRLRLQETLAVSALLSCGSL